MKAHWSTSAPNISTSNQNVRTNELPTDRSAQLAVAYANIAIIRSQLRSSVQYTQSLEARAGEIWGHVALHEGFGFLPGYMDPHRRQCHASARLRKSSP
jgi:2-iminoacetate synthase ThiH